MSTNSKRLPVPVAYNRTEEIPIKYEDRTCTDVFCAAIGILFSLALLICAFVMFNWDTFVKSNFPTDSDGNLCGVDAPAYPYIYFANPPQIARRICVSKCPTSDDTALDCLMTENIGCRFNDIAGFEVQRYDTYSYNGRIGLYCLPSDDSLREELLHNANLENRMTFINSLDSIVLSMILAFSFSLLYLVLVQCWPKFMNKAVIVLASLIILALVICMFAYHYGAYGKIFVAIVLLVLFFLIILSSCKNRRCVDMNGVFLSNASQMLGTSKCLAFFYIPLFIVLLAGFIFLVIYEFRSYWAGGSLTFDAETSIFWEFNSAGPIVLTVFLAIQVIWGLSFLKEAFNYCVSGNAVSWYYHESHEQWSCIHPMQTLLCKHFGSVVGGSFMTGFFSIGDYIFDLVKPRVDAKRSGCYYKTFNAACSPCTKVFDLVRSDAMAYINIAGNPYCNAARYCEYLSDNSVVLEAGQSASRTYRLCAHLFIAGIVGLICLYVKGQIAPISLLLIFLISIFISTFFISIHADAADAIAISFMDNEECEKRTNYGGQTVGARETIFDTIAVKHREVAEQVKEVLVGQPYRQKAVEY